MVPLACTASGQYPKPDQWQRNDSREQKHPDEFNHDTDRILWIPCLVLHGWHYNGYYSIWSELALNWKST